ncbi:DoxX family protein [Limnovirga soli]|uniref:DoxX family membrane protein n=1 Tax=Limnovirga soli TaxID=2656915 RepID=A0A8J8FGS1_9BACT|nr:MauE/DoxX family redox-associated membrane protein [Limnovirga soli]NNV56362.1 DoxX family membrane protein [Limnovirga soli]
MQQKLKLVSRYLMVVFYLFGGINHFANPANYLSIIPPYLPQPELINYIAGVAEIGGAVLLLFSATRNFAAWGIIAMLLAFMPAHIYMIQEAPLQMGEQTITPMVAWVRIPLQALLIWWAYSFTNKNKNLQ